MGPASLYIIARMGAEAECGKTLFIIYRYNRNPYWPDDPELTEKREKEKVIGNDFFR